MNRAGENRAARPNLALGMGPYLIEAEWCGLFLAMCAAVAGGTYFKPLVLL